MYRGGGYSVSVIYKSLLFNIFSLAPPQLSFFVKYRQKRSLRVSFIELKDFTIYQHVNKRTNILALATYDIAHLCSQFNHVCPANFYNDRLKALFFIKIALKLLFLRKSA